MHSNIHTNHSPQLKCGSVDKSNSDDESSISYSGVGGQHNNGIKKKKSKKVACVACHKAHARCDKSCNSAPGSSCSRCIKLGIQCVEQIKKKTSREERLRSLHEHRKNSLHMKILPRASCSTNTSVSSSSTTSSTSPHSNVKISPSTPSPQMTITTGLNSFFNGQLSPPYSCSQSSASSTSESTCSSSNNSSTTPSNSYLLLNQVFSATPSSLNYPEHVSVSQAQTSSSSPNSINCPQNSNSNSNQQPPNHIPSYLHHHQAMTLRMNTQHQQPFIPNFVSPSVANHNNPFIFTQSGLPQAPPSSFALQPQSVNSFTNSSQHMHFGHPPLPQQPQQYIQTQQSTYHSSSVNNNNNNNNTLLETDNQSTYTSMIFPSSTSRNAQFSEMLDSYSLPNPDDLEQLFSSLENARKL